MDKRTLQLDWFIRINTVVSRKQITSNLYIPPLIEEIGGARQRRLPTLIHKQFYNKTTNKLVLVIFEPTCNDKVSNQIFVHFALCT